MTLEQRACLRDLLDGEADDQYKITMVSYSHHGSHKHLTVQTEMNDVIERQWFRHTDVYDEEGRTFSTRSVPIYKPAWTLALDK